MIFTVINVTLSLVVGAIVAFKLGWLHDRFSLLERVGLGLLGAGCVLTIGPILGPFVAPTGSPYDDWAGPMMRLGIAINLIGRVLRYDLLWRKAP